MNTKETGGPAFPIPASEYGGHGTAEGMTLRDYLAAKAMPSIWNRYYVEWFEEEDEFPSDFSVEIVAEHAYAMADAMLKARAA